MYKIFKRDEYIKEVYEPMMEQKKYEELKLVNEGLLKNLFGMVKNLFKKDWDTIKGDKNIIQAYREMDDALTGFSMMKMAKKGECNQIRQALVDFACDWYDMKMNNAKDTDEDPKPAKSMKFKNDTLRENLESLEKKIKDIAAGDEQMMKWANTLKEDMKTVINRSILDNVENEETKKELEKQIADAKKAQEEINKKMEEWQNEQLNAIQEDRKKLITDAGADPGAIKDDLLGDKAIQNLCDAFNKFREEKDKTKRKDLMMKDTMFGFKKLFTKEDYEDSKFDTTYKLMNSFYTSLAGNDVMTKFKETPGPSVQAMCISINAFIKDCVFENSDYSDTLPLMAKCAIISNGAISYSLPLNDAATKDPNSADAGNYFTDIIAIITKGGLLQINSNGKESEKPIKLPKNFGTNSKTLLNKIQSEAKKLKEEFEKNYNEQLKKLKLGDEQQ